jgi:hypothetical protein
VRVTVQMAGVGETATTTGATISRVLGMANAILCPGTQSVLVKVAGSATAARSKICATEYLARTVDIAKAEDVCALWLTPAVVHLIQVQAPGPQRV